MDNRLNDFSYCINVNGDAFFDASETPELTLRPKAGELMEIPVADQERQSAALLHVTTALPMPVLFHFPLDAHNVSVKVVLLRAKSGYIYAVAAAITECILIDDGSLQVGERIYHRTKLDGHRPNPGWFHSFIMPFTEPINHQAGFTAFKGAVQDGFNVDYTTLAFSEFLKDCVREAVKKIDPDLGTHIRTINNKHLDIDMTTNRRKLVRSLSARLRMHAMAPRHGVAPKPVQRKTTMRSSIFKEPAPKCVMVIEQSMEIIKPFVYVVAEKAREVNNSVLMQHLSAGLTRPLLMSPKPEVLLPLYEQFANFKDAIDVVYDNLCLASRGKPTPFHIQPMLLSGSPGIGKSELIFSLAKALGFRGRSVTEIDMSTSNQMVVCGSSSNYESSRQGILLDTFLDEDSYANSFVLGDELDKAGSNGDRHSISGSLLSLLESSSAAKFHDLFLDNKVSMNASALNWVFSSNGTESISEPLLSRMDTIQCRAPNLLERKLIASNIYKQILINNEDSWGKTFPADLNQDVIELLASNCESPRALKMAINRALGAAGRDQAHSISCDHILLTVPQTKRRIGF